jgi:hypothetical protein
MSILFALLLQLLCYCNTDFTRANSIIIVAAGTVTVISKHVQMGPDAQPASPSTDSGVLFRGTAAGA